MGTYGRPTIFFPKSEVQIVNNEITKHQRLEIFLSDTVVAMRKYSMFLTLCGLVDYVSDFKFRRLSIVWVRKVGFFFIFITETRKSKFELTRAGKCANL